MGVCSSSHNVTLAASGIGGAVAKPGGVDDGVGNFSGAASCALGDTQCVAVSAPDISLSGLLFFFVLVFLVPLLLKSRSKGVPIFAFFPAFAKVCCSTAIATFCCVLAVLRLGCPTDGPTAVISAALDFVAWCLSTFIVIAYVSPCETRRNKAERTTQNTKRLARLLGLRSVLSSITCSSVPSSKRVTVTVPLAVLDCTISTSAFCSCGVLHCAKIGPSTLS